MSRNGAPEQPVQSPPERSAAPRGEREGSLAEEVRWLKARLAELTEEVARNEALLHKTQDRELELLRAGSLADLLRLLIHGLRTSYQLDGIGLLLLDPDHEVRHLLASDGIPLEELIGLQFIDGPRSLGPRIGTMDRPWLGPFRERDHRALLPAARNPGSLAIIPLRRNEKLDGVLIFSSADRFRFTRELATDFLAHLGLITAICLENAVNRARLVHSGLTDFLTGFHNRRYLQARLHEELARAQRDHRPVACLMIDVDHFKRINDEFGHLAGDAVLREVANRIDGQMRLSDTGARFGGDEFAIVLPHGTLADAHKVAARVLEAVRGQPIAVSERKSQVITLSIGLAAAAPDAPAVRDYKALAERLIAAADAALYRAKTAGRNRVESSTTLVS